MLNAMTRRTPATPSATRPVRIAALAAAGAIGLSGCVSGSGTGPTSSPSAASPTATQGSAQPTNSVLRTQWANGGLPVRVDIMSLDKISNDAVALRLRLMNISTHEVSISDAFRPRFGIMNSFGGVALVDGRNLRAYYPWQNSNDSKFVESGFPDFGQLSGGQEWDASILFPPPPPNVTTVNVYAPQVTFSDVPINQNGKGQEEDPGFNKADLNAPNILPLTSSREDLSGDKTEDDSGNKVAIRLSSDVLFKLNKADLTSKANAILKQVATQIDQAKATTIAIDGYTDSSGNDAINNPLSKKRAEAVHSALQKLVTRQGISYKIAGHGSADPVASNKTAEGSQKNRRVTISYNK
jgi:outer membrane protein OmpA-like peptidoglycan-associated protein